MVDYGMFLLVSHQVSSMPKTSAFKFGLLSLSPETTIIGELLFGMWGAARFRLLLIEV